MTEALTNDLGNARNEIMSLRREIENRKYLYQQSPDDVINVSRHRNEHQKARCDFILGMTFGMAFLETVDVQNS